MKLLDIKMNIIIFDTEFFSLSKKKSNLKYLKKYQNLLFPEIIQLGAYKYTNFFLNKKPRKMNIFFNKNYFIIFIRSVNVFILIQSTELGYWSFLSISIGINPALFDGTISNS